MAAMKRDVNIGLLILIVAALLMFSGFTVYYQTTFKNVSKSYETKLKELEFISQELESKRGQLNETSVQLQLNRQKEADISKKFTDVRSEKEQLEIDKKKLQDELASTKSSLASTAAKLTETQSQLGAQVQLAQDLNQQVLSLKSDVKRLDDKADDLKRRIACLHSTNGQSETC